jgi:hypothetical protein
MYTQVNFECTVGEVGSERYSEYSLYSIFTNALKQARQIQRDDCNEAYDEDSCNEDDDCWAKRTVVWGCFSPRLDERSEASSGYVVKCFEFKLKVCSHDDLRLTVVDL